MNLVCFLKDVDMGGSFVLYRLKKKTSSVAYKFKSNLISKKNVFKLELFIGIRLEKENLQINKRRQNWLFT